MKAAVLLTTAAVLTDCAATPESCQIGQNTTGAGAVIGAGAGLALGGLAAGLSHQRGGAAAGIVLGAAALGAVIGAAVAHQHDEACHQLALRQALDYAAAENARLQQAEAERQAAEREPPQQGGMPIYNGNGRVIGATPSAPSRTLPKKHRNT